MAESTSPRATELLIEHLRRVLIHELSTTRVEAWLGKHGVVEHDVQEIAEIAVRALWPLVASKEAAESIQALHRAGELVPPVHLDPNDW